MVEVTADTEPAEGEVLMITTAGGFMVKGTLREIAARLEAEPWPTFELAESEDTVLVRSSQVVALRGGRKPHRRGIGFAVGS